MEQKSTSVPRRMKCPPELEQTWWQCFRESPVISGLFSLGIILVLGFSATLWTLRRENASTYIQVGVTCLIILGAFIAILSVSRGGLRIWKYLNGPMVHVFCTADELFYTSDPPSKDALGRWHIAGPNETTIPVVSPIYHFPTGTRGFASVNNNPFGYSAWTTNPWRNIRFTDQLDGCIAWRGSAEELAVILRATGRRLTVADHVIWSELEHQAAMEFTSQVAAISTVVDKATKDRKALLHFVNRVLNSALAGIMGFTDSAVHQRANVLYDSQTVQFAEERRQVRANNSHRAEPEIEPSAATS